MHQPGMLAARRKHLCHHRFLADVLLADVPDAYSRRRGQTCRLLAYPLTQRFGEFRIVEDAHVGCVEELCHPVGITHRRQRSGDHYL
jgi:hypothetical protein